MAKQPYKIWEIASLLLAAIVVVGGAFALLTAPDQTENKDQKLLQQELLENAALLESENISASSASPVLPGEIPTASAPAETRSQEKNSPAFTAIGDSVMLGAVPEIRTAFPCCIIDAKESRQVWDANSIIRDLDAGGNLLDTVVIALGSNGSFGKSSGQELIDTLGHDRTIYWIAPFGQYLTWQESTLRILHELAAENENVTILDWPEIASGHADWFYEDGMHLNAAGQTGYAEFMLAQLNAE